MAKGVFKNLNNSKVKRFLFFFTLAAIFWVFTKFSREFTSSRQTEIEYVNIPETAALSSNNVHSIDFDLTANGFEILFYKFKKPAIEVNVGDYLQNNKLEFDISNKQLARLLELNYKSSKSIKNLSVEKLKVQLDPIVLKKIPVVVSKSISYKKGFKALASACSVRDSVIIAGPAKVLDSIYFIETEVITEKNVDRSISKTIRIKQSIAEIISIKPQEVTVKIDVAEFSQGQFSLPIEVVNVPPNMDIKLVPSSVVIKFDVSVNDFANISKENFRVVCDYSKMNKEGNFMIPFLESKPKNIYNIVFEPKKIDLLIVK